jgi:hypothetical protein
MKIKTWHEGMSDAESKDLAYWERNMLALKYAQGWYNDDVVLQKYWECPETGQVNDLIIGPRYQGWRRVMSLEGGAITFHIPDDFPVGNLPEIERNWDGHTTEEKWRRIAEARGIQ